MNNDLIVLPESLCGIERELMVWGERSIDYISSLPALKPRRSSRKAIDR